MGCEYQYRMTNRAVLDVRETVSYFRNELQNEKAAATWMNDVEKCIGRLCIFPESGTIVYAEYLPQAQVRKKVVRNYILYYQILQEQKNDSDTPCYLWTKKSAERTAGFQ